MPVLFYQGGIDFEWDDAKAASNWSKHQIRFEEASRVFIDPYVRYDEDEGDYGEVREYAIGRIDISTILYVVFVERPMCIRIISARPATRAEIYKYEND